MQVSATPDTATPSRWMSLGQVSRVLHVNEATLRQWADRGQLRAYRTPGGHRRFLREDVEALTQRSNRDAANSASAAAPIDAADAESLVLRRIRRKLSGLEASPQSWRPGSSADGRDRMRLFGRRLLSLLLQNGFTARGRRRGETLSETQMLGHEYGLEMAERGVLLADSVQAFLFFRQAVVESVPPELLRQVIEISDQVLLGLVRAYGDHTPPGPSENAAAPSNGDTK